MLAKENPNIRITIFNIHMHEILNIVCDNNLSIFSSNTNYINANSICVYCKVRSYIGTEFRHIPDHIHGYFMSVYDFEKYCKKVKELGL